jgi:hypothetical protein
MYWSELTVFVCICIISLCIICICLYCTYRYVSACICMYLYELYVRLCQVNKHQVNLNRVCIRMYIAYIECICMYLYVSNVSVS